MTIQISNTLNWISFTVQFHLITLHYLLNCLTDIAETHVNTCRGNSHLSRFLDSLQERIVPWIEAHCPCRINNTSINLTPKVHLHDIIILQYRIITRIGRVMCRHMVQTASCWKSNTSPEPIFLNQFTIFIFEHLTHVRKFNTWLDEGLGIGSYLPMNLGSLTDLGVYVLLQAIMGTFFSRRFTIGVGFQWMGSDFSFWVFQILGLK
mmetsp:Transcript_27562/g.42200  ORF Transcript_27562/g.42200 Transcript_27562/m.42200 type:complete len:207 (-) Transcript_27562:401-1021(-)